MGAEHISVQTLRRLPIYLHYLNSIRDSQHSISATAISDAFGLNDVQVRKDLATVSGSGRPRTGYYVDELIRQIEDYLGCNTKTNTVLVGAGNLGKALLSYGGFQDYGLEIIAAFDRNPLVYGKSFFGKPILSMGDLEVVCREKQIRLGIITAPAPEAQGICDLLTSYGVKAIWNFAPTILRASEGVLVENENLASSLAILSRHLQAAYPEETEGGE